MADGINVSLVDLTGAQISFQILVLLLISV